MHSGSFKVHWLQITENPTQTSLNTKGNSLAHCTARSAVGFRWFDSVTQSYHGRPWFFPFLIFVFSGIHFILYSRLPHVVKRWLQLPESKDGVRVSSEVRLPVLHYFFAYEPVTAARVWGLAPAWSKGPKLTSGVVRSQEAYLIWGRGYASASQNTCQKEREAVLEKNHTVLYRESVCQNCRLFI